LGRGWRARGNSALISAPEAARPSITAALAPAASTGAVAAIVDVPAGGSFFSTGTANVLFLGTSGNDNVQTTNGYACFVGGGPEPGNGDQITAVKNSGSQCVVATSAASNRIKNCTIVQRSP
jgi:hypothetical protein